jgi:hypothetical protein
MRRAGLALLAAGGVVLALPCSALGQPGDKNCPAPATVSTSATEPLQAHPSYSEARAAAVRRALTEAVERVAGAEIATSFRSRTTASTTSVNSEAQQNLRTRSKGRVRSWTETHEETVDDSGIRSVSVTVQAKVCPNGDTDQPAIVAFAFEPLADAGAGDAYRQLMGSLFPASPRFTMTLEPPDDVYYDVLVSARVLEAGSTIQDNTGDIALLRRFLPAAALPQIPDHVQRVTVRVMTKAERLTGGADLVEVGTGARDIAPGMDPKPVIHDLVEEALVDAAKRLYGRLTAAGP